jgi:uncharacterized protein (TIGR02145 family)
MNTNLNHPLIMRTMKVTSIPAYAAFLFVAVLPAAPLAAYSQAGNHTCGAANVHNPSTTYGTATDIDGNAYKTVVIDDKVWFAENLKVTHFQNGDAIPLVSDSAAWSVLASPGMCSYRNDPTFDCPYGKLYNHHVVTDPRNVCPSGWRVPSVTDLYDLIFHLDPNANPQQPGNQPNTAGGPLKSTGLTYWRSPNATATNGTGFSAIPNGGRNPEGRFSFSYDAAASYWLSTLAGPSMGFFLELAYPQGMAVRNAYFSEYAACIRCVTDVSTLVINDLNVPDMDIYPNPTNGSIVVQTGSSMLGERFEIVDLMGRSILQGTIVSTQTTITLEQFPAGMYFMRFPERKGPAKRIVKE